jgi:type IV pilus assembly protein PilV
MKAQSTRGVALIEVLIAIVVTVFGLLAMVAMQLRATKLESESYQRTQAILLVDDMAQRIKANRTNVAAYEVSGANAVGGTVNACNGTRAAIDICEWGNLITGSAERDASNNPVGAMMQAKGCVSVAAPAGGASGATTVVVGLVWRGHVESGSAATLPCAVAGYTAGDSLVRSVSTVVRLGDLDG